MNDARADSRPIDDPGSRWYFLHVHKAAGTAMRHVLAQAFPPSAVCPAERFEELAHLGDPAGLPYRLYSGHFGARIPGRIPDVEVLTTVRDPLARAWSHFHQIRRFPGHPVHEVARRAAGIRDFLAHPEGRFVLTNLQARLLAAVDRPEGFDPLRHPSARGAPGASLLLWVAAAPDEPADELLDRARARIDGCRWVGTVERLDEAVALLGHEVGWRFASPVRLHARPASAAGEPSPADLDAIGEVTALDRAIHAYAADRLAADLRRLVAGHLDGATRRRIAASSRVLEGTVRLGADRPWVGWGWWEAQVGPDGRAARWTGPDADATVLVPLALPAGTAVVVEVVASRFPDGIDRVDLHVDGRPVPTERRDTGRALVLRGRVPATTGPVTEIVVRTPEPPRWCDDHPGSSDAGRRGVAVAAISLVSEERS